MKRTRRLAIALSIAVVSRASDAQNIPVRTLTTAVATDSGVLLTATVRPLSNGSAIVNDQYGMRLFLFDAALKPRTISDTSGATPNRYPAVQSPILAYLGDTTLLVDRNARVFIVVDPSGGFGRTIAPPVASDFTFMTAGSSNTATDPRGRLVYRVGRRTPPPPRGSPPPPPPDSGKMNVTVVHDSAVVVRANFDTRSVDSAATVGQPVSKRVMVPMGSAGGMGTIAVNPLPSSDDWAMLSDGTIAVVRVGDYHVDFYGMDGTRNSAPKMAFDWKRVTDEDKQRMLDSAKQRYEDRRADAEKQMAKMAPLTGGVSMYSMGDGITIVSAAGGKPQLLPFVAVEPSDLPDYYPPIRSGTVRADQDGNLWILPTTSTLSANGLVYDVVNNKGVIIERVKLPPNRRLMAVGKGGVVYMGVSDHGFRLERATIVR
jgi:hypothetical protein